MPGSQANVNPNNVDVIFEAMEACETKRSTGPVVNQVMVWA